MAKTRIISQDIGDATVLPADLDVSADNTTADATTGHHGLLPKLGGGSTNYLRADGTWAAPSGSGAPASVDYLVGTADGGLSAEIVVGTSPGGELGGTWASPTVNIVHAGATAWTDYTPTWTTDGTAPVLNNGTLQGRYKKLDSNTVLFRVTFVAGSSTTFGTGNWLFALPFTAAAQIRCHVYGVALDSSAGTRDGVVGMIENAGTTTLRLTPDTGNAITNTVPWTWATSDELNFSGWIEI